MKPASENDLSELRKDYAGFLNLKNSELKSAYLACSGRGFNNVVKSGRDVVMMERETDHAFVVCSYPRTAYEIVQHEEKRAVRFHTDQSSF